MHPQQLRHTYLQCGAETDRRGPRSRASEEA